MRTELIRRVDPETYELIRAEERRQRDCIRLIVLAALSSVFTNKYSEGYPRRRYYQGQVNTNAVEILAIKRARALFDVEHVNVQPYSGSPANQAVYMALCEPGDTIVGLGLPSGGHLSHGWNVNFSGILYDAHQYGVDKETERIDLDAVRELCLDVKPKVISVGTTAYPRALPWEGFAEIAEEVGAKLFADIAHVAGLVAGGAYPSPTPVADVTTTTTHKTLRGPRGGMIMCGRELKQDINRAVFPGLQGGPHMNQIAALAVALSEACKPEFKDYAKQVVNNARTLALELERHGMRLVAGGTDSHLILVDLTPRNISGKDAAVALEKAGIVCNYNSIPYDPRPPMDPSGIRIGTPCVTSRGLKHTDMEAIANWINEVLDAPDDDEVLDRVRVEVAEFLQDFPAPGLENVDFGDETEKDAT